MGSYHIVYLSVVAVRVLEVRSIRGKETNKQERKSIGFEWVWVGFILAPSPC